VKITGTSSYLPNFNYAVGDTNLPFGRGMLRPGYAPSEASVDSSSFSLRSSTCPGRFEDPPVHPVRRGGVGRGQYLGGAAPIGKDVVYCFVLDCDVLDLLLYVAYWHSLVTFFICQCIFFYQRLVLFSSAHRRLLIQLRF